MDLGELGLRGWQSLGGFLVFRVVRVDDPYHVHSWLPELFLLCCRESFIMQSPVFLGFIEDREICL